MDEELKKDVINILRTLADNLESDNLSSETVEEVYEYFLKYKFITSLFNDIKGESDNGENGENGDSGENERENSENSENNLERIKGDDMLKFMSLGWHIYKNLMPSRDERDNERGESDGGDDFGDEVPDS